MSRELLQESLEALKDAVKAAQKALKESPTNANVKALEAARKALKSAMEEESEAMPQAFANLRAVAAYLTEEGWKVSESTVYLHREQGKLGPDAEGRYPIERVVQYAETHLERLDGSDRAETAAAQKALSEARRIAAQAEILEIKAAQLRGELVSLETAQLELAARAAILVSDFRSFAHALSPKIIETVQGDRDRTADLVAFLLAETAEFFDRYAKEDTFTAELVEK